MPNLKQQIINLFTKKSATIITLYTRTKPKLKSGHPFNNLYKISMVNGVVNCNFAAALAKLGKAVDQRSWGKRLSGSFIGHNGNRYLEIRPINTKSLYFDGNRQLSFEEIKPYLPAYQEQDIPTRTYNLDNVIGFAYDGETNVAHGFKAKVTLLRRA